MGKDFAVQWQPRVKHWPLNAALPGQPPVHQRCVAITLPRPYQYNMPMRRYRPGTNVSPGLQAEILPIYLMGWVTSSSFDQLQHRLRRRPGRLTPLPLCLRQLASIEVGLSLPVLLCWSYMRRFGVETCIGLKLCT